MADNRVLDAMDLNTIEDVFANAFSKNKKLSVERIYQKKTQLEHILLRPDTYIGSVEPVTQPMWVYDNEAGMVNREVTFVPGLYKIFDEILVNAADNKQRDKNMNCIKIDIDAEGNKVSVWNNGQGIPVVEHKGEKMFVPSLIFGHLLTSSNYNDEEKKVTGGRNGYGAKLCNIFSTKFTVETSSKQYNKFFKQTWLNNMSKASDPKITPAKSEDYTCITFCPDLPKFQMSSLDRDIVALMSRRAFDIAGCTKGVRVFLNGKKLPIKGFKDYVEMYTKNKDDESGEPLKLVHEIVNERWEVVVTLSISGFQQISFVNNIATTKGGSHVSYITDQLASKIAEHVKKKNKSGKDIRPHSIKSHLWVFVNCLIENPTFDSQTKENMTLQAKSFGSKCAMSEKFITSTLKCGVVDAIMSWVNFKAQTELQKKCSSKKHTKLRDIPKLEDANDAGTRSSLDCTLILTEGDSAKTLAVSGLGVIGRDKYGVFPLKGKMLNVREATHKQILENAEINNVIKIMGLQYKKKYETTEDLKSLRYGRLMIMTDQDQDGSHIKGLLINFIHHNWPSLLRLPFLEEFITPIVKARKGKEEKSFFSLPEFLEWKCETSDWATWKVKYYKGLGTSTSNEAKEYFSDMNRHRIKFQYAGTEDDNAIQLAFSKKMVDMRKEWLTNGMEERKRRRELGLPELYLYGKGTTHVTYNDFVNKELILFSNMDNERSIPSLIDGLKPGQRKVLFTCLKKNYKDEVKVAQLAGAVALCSAYHHGEMSLTSTIINLAQNFVGSNNLNLLVPSGQFGTRLQGGKDAASPRYIFTKLSSLARHIFSALDEPLLKFLYDDNKKIEPEYYVPIIPMVLINGADGIGTAWSTKVSNYNPRELVQNILRMMDGEEPRNMIPWYKNFTGMIEEVSNNHYVVSGMIHVNRSENKIEITELPVKTWTQTYKENVLEPMLHGSEKIPPFITDYKEYHTDKTVRFVITMTAEKFREAEHSGFFKVFKLQSQITTQSMVLFDRNCCLRKFESATEILKEFFEVRSALYVERRVYLLGMLKAEALRLENQVRFILEKIGGKIVIENRKKVVMIQTLQDRGYDSDPVLAWKNSQTVLELEEGSDNEDAESEAKSEDSSGPDFNYLLGMKLWSLTLEKKEELLKTRDEKNKELQELDRKSPSDLWRDDLNHLLEELDKVEAKEKEEDNVVIKPVKGKNSRKKQDKIIAERRFSDSWEKVAFVVDNEWKKKHEKKPVNDPEKKKRTKKDIDMERDLDLDEPLIPLAGRVSLGKRKGKELSQKVSKKTKVTTSKKAKSPKGARKGKQLESSSESEHNISDFSDDEMICDLPTEKRSASSRAVTAKSRYTFGSSEDDDSDEEFHDHNPEGLPIPINDTDSAVKTSKAKNVKKGTKVNRVPSTVDEEDEDHVTPDKPAESEKTKSPDAAPSTDALAPVDVQGPKAVDASKKNVASKKRTAKILDNSSDDDDFAIMSKKAAAPAKKAAATAKKAAAPVKKAAPIKTKITGVAAAQKTKAKKPRKRQDSFDSEKEQHAEMSPVKPRTMVGRSRAPISYDFGDDSSDGY